MSSLLINKNLHHAKNEYKKCYISGISNRHFMVLPSPIDIQDKLKVPILVVF